MSTDRADAQARARTAAREITCQDCGALGRWLPALVGEPDRWWQCDNKHQFKAVVLVRSGKGETMQMALEQEKA